MGELTEALEAARGTRAYRAGTAFDVPASGVEQYTTEVIRAAAPIIRRQVAEEIAQAIASSEPATDMPSVTATQRAISIARRIGGE